MSPAIALPLRPRPPAWVTQLFDGHHVTDRVEAAPPGVSIVSCRTDAFTLLASTVAGAAELPAGELSDTVAVLYRALAREVEREQRHFIRVWNFVPDIQGDLGAGDRYMTFNAGRFSAFCDSFGGAESFPSRLPTASAVGVSGPDLSIHVPRGRRAWLAGRESTAGSVLSGYSRRYGPRPPCFSRATRLGSTLLIGGTASILGQHSRHDGDIDAQVCETMCNLAALIESAAQESGAASLESLRSLRVHVRDAHDAPVVERWIERLMPNLPVAEFVQAPLCRRELLVEIEGVAELQS